MKELALKFAQMNTNINSAKAVTDELLMFNYKDFDGVQKFAVEGIVEMGDDLATLNPNHWLLTLNFIKMRLLTIAFQEIQENFNDLSKVRYDEKGGADAIGAMAADLTPIYNPGYTDANGDGYKNAEALLQVFKDVRKNSQQSKDLSDVDFVNKQGTRSSGVEAVKSMSDDVEALNNEE